MVHSTLGFAQDTEKSYRRARTHEFFLASGYNYCQHNFVDIGLRYYPWTNDGQQIMAFSGVNAGCEISLEGRGRYIPYLGWQGQALMIGAGVRVEYGFSGNQGAFGLTPELGYSFFEFLRITGGYRFVLAKKDSLEMRGGRLSIVLSIPLSFLKKD